MRSPRLLSLTLALRGLVPLYTDSARYSALAEEMKYDHNQRDDQQNVNQAAYDLLENQKAEHPDDEQNYSDAKKHRSNLR